MFGGLFGGGSVAPAPAPPAVVKTTPVVKQTKTNDAAEASKRAAEAAKEAVAEKKRIAAEAAAEKKRLAEDAVAAKKQAAAEAAEKTRVAAEGKLVTGRYCCDIYF